MRGVPVRDPNFHVEKELLLRHASLAALDEVGRGCVAGPVSVGAVLLYPTTPEPPSGVRDSKLLSPSRRTALRPLLIEWAPSYGVGHASAPEVDSLGLSDALRLAATRALALLSDTPSVVLLDGSHDWLSSPGAGFEVLTRVKADRDCASVAAASVLAKTERDTLMANSPLAALYGLAENKGYLTAAHLEALKVHGPSVEHRRSWRVQGVPGFKA